MSKTMMTLILVGAAACGDDAKETSPDASQPPPVDAQPTATCKPDALRTDLAWYGTNREDLTAWLASQGCASTGYDDTKKPVALFDWDNTVSKNDFGDAFTFYLISHDKVRKPASWRDTSPYMTDAGVAALSAACDALVPNVGDALPTSTNAACADEILSMYIDNKTTGGSTAFAGHNWRWMEPTYAWTAQLAAGYTVAELRQFATEAITPQLAAAENTTQTIGTRTVNGWLRIYDQTKDLIKVTQSYGYDTWIITASPQFVIEVFAPQVGIEADHVIGIRPMTTSAGLTLPVFEGCGDVPDGEAKMIPYIQGKRCWVNKVVFGDDKPMLRRLDGQRQVFAAGDSDTDIEFLRDATYRLVINRQKKELMCNAYYNDRDHWRINPMFIQPKSQGATYVCSTACKDEDGVSGRCRDAAGNRIPDQLDAVHP